MSSLGRYQRVGRLVSKTAIGRLDSASVTPSSEIFTVRELGTMSTR